MANLPLKPYLSEQENAQLKEAFSQQLAERLKELRTRKGMKQQELANAATVHLTYISHLEAAKYHPSVFVLWKISKALGVSLNELTNF
jgi:putative transcriptional regulator